MKHSSSRSQTKKRKWKNTTNTTNHLDSSDTDFEDDFSSFTLGGERRKHDPYPQASPTSSQEQQLEAKISALLQSKKKARQQKHKERKRRRKEKKFEEKKKQMDARARTLIRSTIDAKAFAPSTFDCETAYDLWTALQPAEGYTEEEVHRALSMLRIETCSTEMDLVERMHDVVSKVAYIMPHSMRHEQ